MWRGGRAGTEGSTLAADGGRAAEHGRLIRAGAGAREGTAQQGGTVAAQTGHGFLRCFVFDVKMATNDHFYLAAVFSSDTDQKFSVLFPCFSCLNVYQHIYLCILCFIFIFLCYSIPCVCFTCEA